MAPHGSALAALVRIAIEHGLDPVFPPAVEAEVEGLFEGADRDTPPGTDDPTLVDLSVLPFVTIDNESSRDLDQALHVEPDGEGHRVRYELPTWPTTSGRAPRSSTRRSRAARASTCPAG